MIIALTGGTGFIGKYFYEYAKKQGAEIRMLSREKKGHNIFNTDLKNPDGKIINDFLTGADVVVHCAAQINSDDLYAVNVEGTKKLLAMAQGKVKLWVQLSSVGVYGPQWNIEVTEETPTNPENDYEKSKLEADEIIKRSGIPYVILRPSNVVGEDMKDTVSHLSLFSMIRRKLFFYIGPKGASAIYIHVENVAHALWLCVTHPNAINKTFLLSDDTTMEEFVSSFYKTMGSNHSPLRIPLFIANLLALIPRSPLTQNRIRVLTSTTTYSNKKIERELGYRHKISIAESIPSILKHKRFTNEKS